jgi:hypothetical protein
VIEGEGVDIPVESTARGESIQRPSSLPLLFLFPRTEELEGEGLAASGCNKEGQKCSTGVEETGVEEVKIEGRGKELFLPGQWQFVMCF